jgi:hypothetical protein
MSSTCGIEQIRNWLPQAKTTGRILLRGACFIAAVLFVALAGSPHPALAADVNSLIASNDNWQDNLAWADELRSKGLAPQNDLESAVIATLVPGTYTAVMSGGNDGLTQVLVRALGPSLTNAGVKNAVANPTLELRDGNGVLLEQNDNWKDRQQTAIEGTGSGQSGTSGIGLIEVCNLR